MEAKKKSKKVKRVTASKIITWLLVPRDNIFTSSMLIVFYQTRIKNNYFKHLSRVIFLKTYNIQ